MHEHNWITIPFLETVIHEEPSKYVSYQLIQICECGVYQLKRFIHLEDLKNNGDGQK